MNTFYKLTPEEVINMKDLSASEMRILLFLRATTPFGDRPIKLTIRGIAENLEINPSTVSRGLKKLDRLGYISMDLLKVSVTVNPFSPSKDVLRNGIGECEMESANAKWNREIPNGIDRAPEPLPSLDSKPPKTNKTIQTNKKRESAAKLLKILEDDPAFKDFCFRKSAELPDRPVLVESWILAHWEELQSLWLKSKITPGEKCSAAAPAVVEILPKFPEIEEAIAQGILRQDAIFPGGVFDSSGSWWKKEEFPVEVLCK